MLSPPQIQPTLRVDQVIRFQASSALAGITLSPLSLLDMWCLATGTTAAYRVADSVRLRKIEMWGPMASNLSPVTTTLEWAAQAGVVGSPSKLVSDTSMGSSRPAYVTSSPPQGSVQDLWQNSGSAALALLTGPTGTIVDIHLSYRVQDKVTQTAVTAAVAGATVGQVYIRAADSTTTALLLPLNFPTV